MHVYDDDHLKAIRKTVTIVVSIFFCFLKLSLLVVCRVFVNGGWWFFVWLLDTKVQGRLSCQVKSASVIHLMHL